MDDSITHRERLASALQRARASISHPISSATKCGLLNDLIESDFDWAGTLDEYRFISRIWNRESLSSHRSADHPRTTFEDMSSNDERETPWILFADPPLLYNGPDDDFLAFFTLTLHPDARSESDATAIAATINKHLRADRWEFHRADTPEARFAPRCLSNTTTKASPTDDLGYFAAVRSAVEQHIQAGPPLLPDTAPTFIDEVMIAALIQQHWIAESVPPAVVAAIVSWMMKRRYLRVGRRGIDLPDEQERTTGVPRQSSKALLDGFRRCLWSARLATFHSNAFRLIRPECRLAFDRSNADTEPQESPIFSDESDQRVAIQVELTTAGRLRGDLHWKWPSLLVGFGEETREEGQVISAFLMENAKVRLEEASAVQRIFEHGIGTFDNPASSGDVPAASMVVPEQASPRDIANQTDPPIATPKSPVDIAITGAPTSPGGARICAEGCIHSDDFASVRWFGSTYNFTRNQAAVIKVLWEQWEKGAGALSQDTIAERVRGDHLGGFRLRDVFKEARGQHPAWKNMICGVRNGTYALFPEKPR